MAKVNRRLSKPSSHTRLLTRVAIFDVAWGALSPIAAFLLRDGSINSPESVAIYCGVSFFVALLVFQWFRTSSPIARFYSIRDAWELLKACVVIAALSAASSFVLTRLSEAPRSIPVLHFMLLASGLLGVRIILRLRDTHQEASRASPATTVEHVIVVGATRLAWFFTKMVEELSPGGYQIVAVLDERPKLKHRSLNGYPIIGSSADIEKVIADYGTHGVRIDKIVVATQQSELPITAWDEICRTTNSLGISLEVLPEKLMSLTTISNTTIIAGQHILPTTASPVSLKVERPFWKVKRIIDLVVAASAAVMLLPLTILISALVLFDVGIPVVFWQRRIGRNGTPLHLYKFRTLQTLFDRATKERRPTQESSAIGRFLQRTRLDELPQLWNIMAGDMSLIGPRPLLPVDQPDDVTIRLLVRPGLTGWAQVCGGKSVSVHEKTALDEWYIRHASIRCDLRIVLRTIAMLIFTGDCRDEAAISIALKEQMQLASEKPSQSDEIDKVQAVMPIVEVKA